ncbi:hypothetical protein GCM10007049_03710 [Echinicola pacifica]|uniref:BioF2-like acetyltransferase domain-containing protein n=1 Tax=Echinicola pacifica TaxID=346377 RepID=A0A918UJH3_9BACT|nr:GNAT family N-acetyltransferase [Echinicola pacifica]GGZ14943.1 hypothetical protein GCM10007049_03710 [Echinicola pacifica]
MDLTNFEIISGQKARELFRSKDFLNLWKDLYAKCPWSTIFQSPEFIITWFDVYENQDPFLLIAKSGRQLQGLMFLTNKEGESTLYYPGFKLAEYQSWLSTEADNSEFVAEAFSLFASEYPNRGIHLNYLNVGTPIDQLATDSKVSQNLWLKSHEQPLMKCDPEALEKELKKKNKKEKINRLKRLGSLEFVQIKDSTYFESIMPTLAIQNDIRKGAMYGKFAFSDDPKRSEFLIDCFKKGILHTTVYKVDEEIIASNAGFQSESMVHLQGVNTHSPLFAKYSPGILHFLHLGIELHHQGFEYFDLTPGGAGGYKAMLSTDIMETQELFFGSKWKVKKLYSKEFVKNKVKKFLEKDTKGLEKWLQQKIEKKTQKGKTVDQSIQPGYFMDCSNCSKDLYTIKLSELPEAQKIKKASYQKNSLADLLLFDLSDKKQLFISDAMRRLENGQQLYTRTEQDRLISALWLIPQGVKTTSGQKVEEPYIEFSYLNQKEEAFCMDIVNSMIHHESIPLPILIKTPIELSVALPKNESSISVNPTV